MIKKLSILFAPIILVTCQFAAAKQWNTNGNDIHNTNSGNVGIGTTSPISKLNVVEGEIRISATTTNRYLVLDAVSTVNIATMIALRRDNSSRWLFGASGNGGTDNFDFFRYSDTGSFLGSALKLERLTGNVQWGSTGSMLRTDQGGSIELRGTGVPYVDFSNDGSSDYDARMILQADDILMVDGVNVGIGTSNPGSFKLAVEGKVGAREFHVTTTSPWPDYVFDSSYKLRPLSEVEEFINRNKHLPEIPSASEVETVGHQLGEMDALILKKVEELTLYILDQEKKIKNQDKKIKELEDQLIKISESGRAFDYKSKK
jgi:hypothetical protein